MEKAPVDYALPETERHFNKGFIAAIIGVIIGIVVTVVLIKRRKYD